MKREKHLCLSCHGEKDPRSGRSGSRAGPREGITANTDCGVGGREMGREGDREAGAWRRGPGCAVWPGGPCIGLVCSLTVRSREPAPEVRRT